MRLRQFRIGARLRLGFAAVVGLSMAIALGAIAELRVDSRRLQDINGSLLVNERIATEWRNAILINNVRTGILIRSADPGLNKQIKADMKITSARVSELQKELTRRSDDPASIQLLADIASRRKAMFALRDPIIALKDQGHADEARTRAEGPFAAALNRYLDSVGAMVATQQARIDANAAQLTADNSRVQLVLAALAALSVLISLLLAHRLTNSIVTPLREAIAAAKQAGSGDLTANFVAHGTDETAELARAIHTMQSGMAEIVHTLQRDIREIRQSAESLSDVASGASGSFERQSASTGRAAMAIDQLAGSIMDVKSNANDAHNRADSAKDLATRSGEELGAAVATLDQTGEAVRAASEEVGLLNTKIQEVGAIATLIREVADQTNLLALNAAIEAARAGEYGRGFAVVADEVRKLAERTNVSAQEIGSLIDGVRIDCEHAASRIFTSSNSMETVQNQARTASQSMRQIQDGAVASVTMFGEIRGALVAQQDASTALATDLDAIMAMARQNKQAIESVTGTAQHLQEISRRLSDNIVRFQVND